MRLTTSNKNLLLFDIRNHFIKIGSAVLFGKELSKKHYEWVAHSRCFFFKDSEVSGKVFFLVYSIRIFSIWTCSQLKQPKLAHLCAIDLVLGSLNLMMWVCTILVIGMLLQEKVLNIKPTINIFVTENLAAFVIFGLRRLV